MMKEIVGRILEGNFDYDNGSLDFSCSRVELGIRKGEEAEGSFHIYSEGGNPTLGYVISSHTRMECLTAEFTGSQNEICYRFHSEGMEEGEVIQGSFAVISNHGEYYVPFVVSVEHTVLTSSLGNIKNLFHFANLAKSNPPEAVKLFYSPDFGSIFGGNEKQYYNIYRGLSAHPGNEQNVEEFLLSINKKQKIEFYIQETEIKIEDPDGIIEAELSITKNGWGYTRLTVETEGEFLYAEKEFLSDDDFLGNYCTLPIYVDSTLLHAGNNFGMVRIYSAYEELQIPVFVKCHSGMKKGRTRLQKKHLIMQLMEFYQAFRMKQISTSTWLKETGKLIEKLTALDDKDVSARLFQAQLLITEERMNEAQWILDHVADILENDDNENAVLWSYYLYLTTLISRDDAYIDKIAEEVTGIYRRNRDNWRIAWLLLYLSGEYTKSTTRKWLFLEEQFNKGCLSPVIYIEALLLVNANPSLLMKLGEFEKQVIGFGAKREILTTEVIHQFVYLVQKVRDYSTSLYRILEVCYKITPDDGILQEICALLIKGGKSGREYFKWYKRGVESELRITRLYEYYMMSADLYDNSPLPRMVLMYFSYQSNLSFERMAHLYVNVHRYRESFPELYENYREPIERFVTEQILKMHINRDLAYLYKNILEPRILTVEAAQALGRLLFMNLVQTDRKDIREAIVYHGGLDIEYRYSVTEGKAWIPLFGSEYTILFEDGSKNRYTVSIAHTMEKLVIPGKLIKSITPMVENQIGFDLFLCFTGKDLLEITQENEKRFLYILRFSGINIECKRDIGINLLHYYYEYDKMQELDDLLDTMDRDYLTVRERSEILRFLVIRGKNDKAYEWLTRFGPDGTEPNTLVRLCSRLLEKSEFADDYYLTRVAAYAFQRGKYDENILRYLIRYYEGTTKELRDIWKAADSFEVNSYELCEKMLIQMLFTGSYIGEKMAVLRCYINGGAKAEIEAAFLAQCAYDYFVKDRLTESYVFEEIYYAYARGEDLPRVAKFAFLKYYAENKDEITAENRTVIHSLMTEMMQEKIRLNFFKEYMNESPVFQQLTDKTIVEYRAHPGAKAVIHYMIEREDGTENEYLTEEMREAFGGIFFKEFVLFFGERLQYYIVEAMRGEEQLTESGTIQKSDIGSSEVDNKFNLINDIVMSNTLQDYDTLDTLLEEYYYKEFIREHLFRMI